tara:strand:+ start:3868 stop:4122 length:255 start_codon:yes stop_codon:yes gene_type:complete
VLEFPHALKVHGLTAHGAVGFIALLVPRLGTILTESMSTDKLAVGSRAVADRAFHCGGYILLLGNKHRTTPYTDFEEMKFLKKD